ncbi:hypothetical protein [Cetobacterium sp. SF1]|uniref:hypothetical protein n=1 Tax=Cetobacterium sp. SF1 TaxID=3417654 RepID=UPI003CE6BC5C
MRKKIILLCLFIYSISYLIVYSDENALNFKEYNKYGFDSEGYDRSGFNEEGYNIKGYDINGYDKNFKDKNGVFNIKYSFEKMKPLDSENLKIITNHEVSLLNIPIKEKDEFETTKEYKKRILKEKQNNFKKLKNTYYAYDDPLFTVQYDADKQQMKFTVSSFSNHDFKKVEKETKLYATSFKLPFKEEKNYFLKMKIKDAKQFNKNNLKMKFIFTPMYYGILGTNHKTIIPYDKEAYEEYTDYIEEFDNSIISYKIYDENKVYFEENLDENLKNAFISYGEYILDKNFEYNNKNTNLYYKKNIYYFLTDTPQRKDIFIYNSKTNKYSYKKYTDRTIFNKEKKKIKENYQKF